MEGLRESLRQSVLDGLVRYYRLRGWIPLPETPRIQFIYLHYVYDEQVASLETLLSWLSRHFRIIPYSEAVDRLYDNRVDGVYATLSFDDGLRQTSLNAGRVLSARGLSACFFVCPGVIGTSAPDRLEQFWERINHPPARVLGWSDVDALLEWGHDIGSHTHTHRNLAEVDPSTAEEELRHARKRLVDHGIDRVHFAWPYGRFEHMTAEVVERAQTAGYSSMASAERGCHVDGVADPDQLCIRRDHVHLDWPLEHMRFFLARNAVRPSYQENNWPPELRR